MIGAKRTHRTAALTLTLAARMAMATPALAACGLTAESVARAEFAFVGQLTSASPDGTSAAFKLEEIWRGSGLVIGEIVQIDTTNSLQQLELPPAGVPAPRYLVLANVVDGQPHTGDSCDVFPFPWDASYAAFRPVGAPPRGSEGGGGGPPMDVLFVIGAAVVLVAVSAFAFRRTRTPGG